MSINIPVRPPTVIDAEARRFEETNGDDPAKEFRLSLNGQELIKDEYFDNESKKVTLDDFRDPQNELQRIIKDQEAQLEEMRQLRKTLAKLGFING